MVQTNRSDTDLVTELTRLIGPTLTAFAGALRNRQELVDIESEKTRLHESSRERLGIALELLSDVAEVKGNDLAQAWFIGANTGLADISPAEAIRARSFKDARISCDQMCNPEEMGT